MATQPRTRVYKHTRMKLSDIPIGSPIQITAGDQALFYNGSGITPVPEFVVLAGNSVNAEDARGISFAPLGKAGLTAPQATYYKNYKPYGTFGGHLFPHSIEFNVLTGTKGSELHRLWDERVLTTYIGLQRTNMYSGCDPEIFVVDGTNALLPAWKFLPSKHEAVPIPVVNTHANSRVTSVYWDGFQAEFTMTPSTCMGYGMDNVQAGLQAVLLAARKADPGAQLSLSSVINISPSVLASADNDQVSLGCLPSLNAYGASGEHVEDPRFLPFRFAGGHLHFGAEFLRADPVKYVKALDAIIGVASVGMFAEMDNPLRRRFYGLAGEYRHPKYGLEYRTLSNAWLCHPAVAFLIYDLARTGLDFFAKGYNRLLIGYKEERIQDIINTGDVAGAREWVRENERVYRALIRECYDSQGNRPIFATTALDMIYKGVESVINPTAIETNWLLSDKPTKWTTHAGQPDCQFASLCLRLENAAKVRVATV